MRIKLTYENLNGEPIILPMHYNHVVQALIYRTFSPLLASKLHNQGYPYEKRKFKLFTFSRILEKGKKEANEKLLFKRSISFYFSSAIDDIVCDLGEGCFKGMEFYLFGQKVYVSKVEVLTLPVFEDKILIRMLAPLTIYSTFEDGNGNKKTHYYAPGEINFSELIEINAIKKFSIIQTDLKYDNLQLNVKPVKVSPERNLKVIRFKNTAIEGWTGIYELSGSRELITVTYEAGLGGKNPEGFGMWEVWNNSLQNFQSLCDSDSSCDSNSLRHSRDSQRHSSDSLPRSCSLPDSSNSLPHLHCPLTCSHSLQYSSSLPHFRDSFCHSSDSLSHSSDSLRHSSDSLRHSRESGNPLSKESLQ